MHWRSVEPGQATMEWLRQGMPKAAWRLTMAKRGDGRSSCIHYGRGSMSIGFDAGVSSGALVRAAAGVVDRIF